MPRAPFQIFVFPYRKTLAGELQFAVFKRSDNGLWHGIAGGGEDSETPLQAAAREANEEAGILDDSFFYQLDTSASIPSHCFKARKNWPDNIYVIPEHYFAVDATDIVISLSDEHTEYVWLDYEACEKRLYWHSNKTALWELNERLIKGTIPIVDRS